MNIFVVGGAANYANFIEGAQLVDNLEKADVVLFTGGEDVDPSLYGCKKHPSTYSNINRDLEEKAIFEKVDPSKQVCVGCCRGSQFLAVMNGALLVQDCYDHAIGHTHGITNGDMTYQITSTHHQMQYPYNLDNSDYSILYIADRRRSYDYKGDKIDGEIICQFGEPEIVLYHKKGYPKCLAVQGHPEMIPDSPVAKMISKFIKSLVDENN